MKTLSHQFQSLQELESIFHENRFEIANTSWDNIKKSRQVIDRILADKRSVYGINTGFGKFSETRISDNQIDELQRRIVLSHATGVGPDMPIEIVKWMMIFKIKSFCYGNSGVSIEVVERLLEMLNRQIIPAIPSKGSVGASGDLAPLAHMTLPLLGESYVYYQGNKIASERALELLNFKTIHLKAKDGLAILNGTQAMAAFLASAIIQCRKLLNLADLIASMSLEALCGTSRAFDARIQDVRGHMGQKEVAESIRLWVNGSQLVDSGSQVQDAYSLRCVPQVHGASRDAYRHVLSILETEINGVTDNPLVFIEDNDIISGGNFHGQPLAINADYLAIALAELANISERRIAHLIDPHVSGLPAFLVKEGGLNSGFMICQYTAAALVSENKVLCHPASVDSIPTSANKEDHVSMGAYACRKLHEISDNCYHVLAIELLCAAQAIDLHEKKASPKIQKVHQKLREKVRFWSEDRYMAKDIELAKQFLLDLNI